METEFEVKILDIDTEAIRAKLEALGAERVGERMFRRNIYDFDPPEEGCWIRLRTDGKETTITVKEHVGEGVDGVRELELGVEDFEQADRLLERLGYTHQWYQENRRTSYVLDGVEIELDEWPRIPPYLEIEGKSVEDVEGMVGRLGFSMNDTTSVSTKDVYRKYGIVLHDIRELKFEK